MSDKGDEFLFVGNFFFYEILFVIVLGHGFEIGLVDGDGGDETETEDDRDERHAPGGASERDEQDVAEEFEDGEG